MSGPSTFLGFNSWPFEFVILNSPVLRLGYVSFGWQIGHSSLLQSDVGIGTIKIHRKNSFFH